MPEDSLRPYYFEADGKLYKVGVPPDYDEQKALRAGIHLLKNGKLKSIPRTEPMTDYSPIEVKPTTRLKAGYGGADAPVPDEEVENNQREQELGKRGIITKRSTKDFSFEEMNELNTAATQDELALAVGKIVKDKYGATNYSPLDMVRFEDGDLLYFDINTPRNKAGTNRWVRFDNPALANPWEVGKAVAGTAGELAGAIPGILYGNAPGARVGGALGAAIATGPIEYARQKKGVKLGINDPQYSQAGWDAIKEGGMVGATSFTADLLMAPLFRPGRINAYYFDPKYADDFDRGLAKGEKTTAEMNELAERLGIDPKFQPSQAKKSGVKELLDLEATLEAQQSSKQAVGIAENIRKPSNESKRTIDNVLEALVDPARVAAEPPRSPEQIGIDIKALADKDTFTPYATQVVERRKLERQLRGLKQDVNSERIGDEEAVAEIRGSTDAFDPRRGLETAKQADFDSERAAWAEVDNRLGVEWRESPDITGMPKFTPVDSVTVPMKPWGEEARSIALNWAKAKNTLFASGTEKQFKDFIEVIEGYVGTGKDIPLSKLVNGIKQLRQLERQNFTRVKNSEYKLDDAFLKQLEGNLVSLRDGFLSRGGHGDILQALNVAEETSKRVHDKWSRSSLAGLLKDDKTSRQILDGIFTPGDGSAASNAASALRGDPRALNALRKVARSRYVDDVYTENGVIDPARYEKFMADYGPAMKNLLDPQDFAQLERFGGLGRALQQSIVRQEVAEKHFGNTFRGKIQNMKAEDIVDKLFFNSSRLGNYDTRQMVFFLEKNSPELLNEVRAGVISRMADKLTKKTGDIGNYTEASLKGLLNQEQKLRVLFGDRYVTDLHTVLKSIDMLKRHGKSINVPTSTPALSMFRVIFGPLSRTQRFISGAKQYQIAGYEKTLFKILSDPDKLRKAIQHGNLPVTSDHAAPILAQLGVQFAEDEQEERAVPPSAYR